MSLKITTFRTALVAVVLIGSAGVIAELLLMDHTESLAQVAPIGVMAFVVAAAIAVGIHPARSTVRVFQIAMAALVVTGAVGVVLHYRGNSAFEREIDASMTGLALVWSALKGAVPVLAPGALVQMGLVGIVASYHHPALRGGADHREEENA